MNDVTATFTYNQHLLLREAAGVMSAKYTEKASKAERSGEYEQAQIYRRRSQELIAASLRLMGIQKNK